MKNESKIERRPQNMTETRDVALDVLWELRNAQIKPDLAKEVFNGVGKIIKSAVAQNEYAIARKEKPEIPFMK